MCFRVLVHEVIRRALNLLTRHSPYWNVRLLCSANTAPSLVMFAIPPDKILPLQGEPAHRRSRSELASVFSSITGRLNIHTGFGWIASRSTHPFASPPGRCCFRLMVETLPVPPSWLSDVRLMRASHTRSLKSWCLLGCDPCLGYDPFLRFNVMPDSHTRPRTRAFRLCLW